MLSLNALFSTKAVRAFAAGAGLSLLPMSAGALSVTAADLPSGESVVLLPGVTVTADPSSFLHKSIAGYDMVGIAGGFENGEIDLNDESISFAFDAPQYVASLDLGALFAAVEEDDLWNEQARVLVYSGQDIYEYILSVVDGTTAVWSGPGTVSNVSPATFGNAAVWSIANPFGNLAVDKMVLTAFGPPDPQDYRNNDYGFVSLTTRPIPEPGTLSLMGLGLAGLAAAGRKRK